jgi:hypothetical protein
MLNLYFISGKGELPPVPESEVVRRQMRVSRE